MEGLEEKKLHSSHKLAFIPTDVMAPTSSTISFPSKKNDALDGLPYFLPTVASIPMMIERLGALDQFPASISFLLFDLSHHYSRLNYCRCWNS